MQLGPSAHGEKISSGQGLPQDCPATSQHAPGVGYPAPGIEGRSSPRNAESRADIPRSLYLIAHFMLKSARLGGQKIKSGPPGRCTTKMDPLGHHGAVGAHAAPSGRVPDLAACQASIYTGPPSPLFCARS